MPSRKEIARRAGVNEHTFENLWKENRKNSLYADDLYLVAKVLNKSMEELVSGQASESENIPIDPFSEELNDIIRHAELSEDDKKELLGAIRMFLIQKAMEPQRESRDAV